MTTDRTIGDPERSEADAIRLRVLQDDDGPCDPDFIRAIGVFNEVSGGGKFGWGVVEFPYGRLRVFGDGSFEIEDQGILLTRGQIRSLIQTLGIS